MQYLRWALGICLFYCVSWGATFGTIVPVLGGAADLVLDEGRGRLYLVNTVQNRVEMLKTVFRWAARNHKIASNPAEGLTYVAKIDPRKERQDFTQDDLRLILTGCRKAAKRSHC